MHRKTFLIFALLLSLFCMSFISHKAPVLKHQTSTFDLHWDCPVCDHWVSNTKDKCPYCGHPR